MAAPLVAAPLAGLADTAPVAAPSHGLQSDAPVDTRQVQRLLRQLRERQQYSGVWQPAALRSLDDFRNLHRDVDAQRSKAVSALLRASRPGQADRAPAQDAITALEHGDSGAALALFARWESESAQRSNARAAAEFARHQGALLAGIDAQQALDAYGRAQRLEAGDIRTQLVMNDLTSYLQASVPSAGLPSAARSAAAGEQQAQASGEALAIGRARIQQTVQDGNAHWQERDVAGALLSFREALRIGERLAAGGAPGADSSPELQRDLSIVHNRIGDAALAQGQAQEAMAAYRQALTLRERLATGAGASVQSQRDLVQSLTRLGDLHARQGQPNEAVAQLGKAVVVAKRLVRAQPALIDAQRDLAGSLERLVDAQLQVGQMPAAKATVLQAQELRQALADRDTGNRALQRDLAANLELSSEVLQVGNERPAALSAARKGLALRSDLAAADTDSPTAQRDLSVSHNRLGDALAAQGERDAALREFRQALALRQALAARDPGNPQWQRDLSVSQTKLADTLALQGDQAGAQAALQSALDIRETLVARDGSNLQWQGDLALALGKMSTLAQLPIRDRQAYLSRGQDILSRLKSQGKLGGHQNWTAWFDAQARLLSKPMVERAGTSASTLLLTANPLQVR